MYMECVNCPKLGVSCAGPKFLDLTTAEVIAWCKARKAFLGLSNGRIAELAKLSKGTVDGLFANAHADFRYETLRPVLKVLVGGQMSSESCPDFTVSERTSYDEKIRQLQATIEWRDEKISHYTDVNKRLVEENKRLVEEIAENEKNDKENQSFMRGEIKRKNRTIVILSIVLFIVVLLIIAALVVDIINPEVGFFWLRSWLGGDGTMDRLIRGMT